MFLLGVVVYFLTGDIDELKTFLLVLPEIKSHSGKEPAYVLAGILNDNEINIEKLVLFVLDNASNNDIILSVLSKNILFDPEKNDYVVHII